MLYSPISSFLFLLPRVQVENCLFKVPRGPFQTESIVFRDMFLLPQGEIVEGLDDERPIKLDGIAKSDFEQLLKVLLFRLVFRTED